VRRKKLMRSKRGKEKTDRKKNRGEMTIERGEKRNSTQNMRREMKERKGQIVEEKKNRNYVDSSITLGQMHVDRFRY
jgi:hypothetical protein